MHSRIGADTPGGGLYTVIMDYVPDTRDEALALRNIPYLTIVSNLWKEPTILHANNIVFW
jgi:hypothetical protein